MRLSQLLLATVATLALATPLKAIEANTIEGRLDSSSETLQDNTYYNIHTFEGVEGESITIELISEDFDAFLLLRDAEGNEVARNDDGGEGKNAKIVVTLPATGTYTVVANTYSEEEVGSYTLTWRDATQREILKAQADELLDQGVEQANISQFREAEQSWQEALALYQEINDHAGVSNSLMNMGNVYFELGEYEQAIDYHQHSLAIFEEIGDPAGIAKSLMNMGTVYNNLGEYEQAIDYYQRSLSIFEEIGDPAGISASLNNLGIAYGWSLGEYEKALDYYQRSLAISEEVNDLTAMSRTFGNLANVYESLGEYERAIDYHKRSLAITEEIGDRAGVSNSLNNLGVVYERLGEYEKAIDYYSRSLAISEEIGNRALVSNSLGNLGVVYERLGEYEKAIDYYSRSLAIDEEIGDRAGVSASLNNLGLVYERLGEYEKAIDYYSRSLATFEEIGDRAGVSKSLGNLGNVYQSLGEYEKAIDYYSRSLAILEEIGDRASEAKIYNNIAFLLKTQNQPATAIVFYKESVNLYEQIRKDIQGLPPDQQKSYLSTVEHTYRNLADLLLSQGRILEAQQVLELLKIQEITNYTRNGEAGGNEPEKIATNSQETEVLDTHGTLIGLGRKILECEINNCDDNIYNSLLNDQEVIASQFETVVRQLEDFIKQRRANDLAFLDPSQVTATSSKIVDSSPNTVLIYPLVLEDKLWILWASEGGITNSIEVTTVGEKELSETVLQLRQLLQNPTSRITELQAVSQKLYDWLIPSQLTRELEANKIENLVFSLDHVTRYIPIDVLYDGNDYLLNRYTISTIISAELTDLSERLPASPSILAGGLSDAVGGFNSLPNVPLELDTIVLHAEEDALGVYPGNIFLNSDLTKDSIRNNLRRHNILHLATHGEFVPGDNYASYLLLGNGEKYPIPDIQKLRGLDNIHLVVLSACETALGGGGNDGTEIAGISYYFLNNGADAVIASLWQVDDESTRLLMESFYQNLTQGMSKAEALRQAKVSLMNEDELLMSNLSRGYGNRNIQAQAVTTAGFEHPYYWASFILIGNGL